MTQILQPPTANKNWQTNNIAVQRLAQQVNNLETIAINVLDYGAIGDGQTDDTLAIQAAGNAAQTANAPLYIPGKANGFLVTNQSSGSCLLWTGPIQIIGDPGLGIIRPSTTVSSNTDIIKIVGNSNTYIRTVIQGVMIGNPSAGTRFGRHALNFSTTGSSQLFLRPIIRDCYLQDTGTNSTGSSVFVNNSTAANSNGGFAYALIDNNFIGSGISINGAGDSIRVTHNNLTGTTANDGIYATLVSGAGNLQIDGNNGGINASCVHIDYADTFDITANEFEHNNTGSTNSIINISGASTRVPGGTIFNNELTVLQGGNTNHPLCINIDFADGIYVDANKIATFTAYVPFNITANAGTNGNIVIGAANYFPTSSTLRLTDASSGAIYTKSTVVYGHTPHASLSASSTSPTTFYVGTDISPTEANIYLRAPYPSAIARNLEMYFGNGAPGVGNSYTCTLRKNGTNTAVTCTISGASNSAGDIAHTASYTVGDQFSISVVQSSGAATAQDIQYTVEFCQF